MNKLQHKSETFNFLKIAIIIISGISILVIAQTVSLMAGNILVAAGLPVIIGNVLAGIMYLVAAFFGVRLFCKKILRITPKECRITKPNVKLVWCMAALIMPLTVSSVLLMMPGHWEISDFNLQEILSVLTGAVLFFGLASGIVEEMVFRGLIMRAVEYRLNKKAAVIIPSVLFALVHVLGNNMGIVSMFQLLAAGSLVGVLFSLVTYESGSIWCSALIHGAWNMIIIGGIVHIGDNMDEDAIFNYVLDIKSFLITGGDYGIQASIVSIAAYIVFAGLAVYLIHRKNDENGTAWKLHNHQYADYKYSSR